MTAAWSGAPGAPVTVDAMPNLHVPTTAGVGGSLEAFQGLVDELPGSRFISDRWKADPMVVLTVVNGEEWTIPPPAYTDAFAHAETVEPVDTPRCMAAVTVLWAPQLAAELLIHEALSDERDHLEVRWAEISPPQYASLRALDPAEMCRRVLLCAAAFAYSDLHEVDVAAAITDAAERAGVDFEVALELVDPDRFDPDALEAMAATIGAPEPS